MPRGGGLACLAGVAAGTAVAGQGRPAPRTVAAVVALATTGFVDDRSGGLPASLRLGVQVGSGVLLGAPHALTTAVSSIAFPAVVNVVNFMDGVNGITGLTSLVWGGNAVVWGLSLDSSALATLGAVTAGAGAGFLPWNAPTASLFLGDVGSYLLGALMAAGIVTASRSGGATSTIAVASPLFLYVADAAQALVRRWRAGERLTEAHREHVYQQLVDTAGFTHLRVSLLHAAGAATVAAAWLGDSRPRLVTSAVVGAYLAAPALAARTRKELAAR
ncbi:hypothetical protein [Barrientosiimonas humi]|uniref:hypothetical protein n=1 Tax=Barrientosiimonas humi TaxID=999931 RepID=UPI00370D4659